MATGLRGRPLGKVSGILTVLVARPKFNCAQQPHAEKDESLPNGYLAPLQRQRLYRGSRPLDFGRANRSAGGAGRSR